MSQSKPPYPVPGLTKAQREVFEQIATGNYTLAHFIRPRAVAKLLALGAIERDSDVILGRDAIGDIAVASYYVPLPLHIAWCEWCSQQPEDDDVE